MAELLWLHLLKRRINLEYPCMVHACAALNLDGALAAQTRMNTELDACAVGSAPARWACHASPMEQGEIMRTAVGIATATLDALAKDEEADGIPAIDYATLKERIDALFSDMNSVTLTLNIPPHLEDIARQVATAVLNEMIRRTELLSVGFILIFFRTLNQFASGVSVADIEAMLQRVALDIPERFE